MSRSLSEGGVLPGGCRCLTSDSGDLPVSERPRYLQVRKLKIEDLPTDHDELAQWLVNLWKEKEEKLRQFYSLPRETRHFENTPNGVDHEVRIACLFCRNCYYK